MKSEKQNSPLEYPPTLHLDKQHLQSQPAVMQTPMHLKMKEIEKIVNIEIRVFEMCFTNPKIDAQQRRHEYEIESHRYNLAKQLLNIINSK